VELADSLLLLVGVAFLLDVQIIVVLVSLVVVALVTLVVVLGLVLVVVLGAVIVGVLVSLFFVELGSVPAIVEVVSAISTFQSLALESLVPGLSASLPSSSSVMDFPVSFE